jgi:hypothetical protein
MNRFKLFKRTFFVVSVGLFAGFLTYGLFDIDFSNGKSIALMILKSLVTALVIGFILGVFNMFLNISWLREKKR